MPHKPFKQFDGGNFYALYALYAFYAWWFISTWSWRTASGENQQ
jgi:hypothetical protein